MAYAIHVRVIQSLVDPESFKPEPTAWFSIVEKTVFRGGYWTECDGEQTLNMGGSGTSGMLRFKNSDGDYFLVALGVHNYKRWCDIVPDAAPSNTGVQIHPSYYANDAGNRGEMLWKQLASLQKTTAKGLSIAVSYYKEDGNTLYATITIGEAAR